MPDCRTLFYASAFWVVSMGPDFAHLENQEEDPSLQAILMTTPHPQKLACSGSWLHKM